MKAQTLAALFTKSLATAAALAACGGSIAVSIEPAPNDAGIGDPSHDAGTDSGAHVRDAGGPPYDAGRFPQDAGYYPFDGGYDAGTVFPPPPPLDSGIVQGCGSTVVTVPASTFMQAYDKEYPDGGTTAAVGDTIYNGPALCTSMCGGSYQQCQVTTIVGTDVSVTCVTMCGGGRLPAKMGEFAVTAPKNAGDYFSQMAALEGAAVHAFRELARELLAHGAPRALVKGCERAAREEVQHTRAMTALAKRYGAKVTHADVQPVAVRSIEAIAMHNAVEGCVRETFGALLGRYQAEHAQDRVVMRVMKRIAEDETRHAALSWSIDAWARTRLSAVARRRVDDARNGAIRELLATSATAPPALATAVGLPEATVERALAASFAETALTLRAA